jgi:hypothetical protein
VRVHHYGLCGVEQVTAEGESMTVDERAERILAAFERLK